MPKEAAEYLNFLESSPEDYLKRTGWQISAEFPTSPDIQVLVKELEDGAKSYWVTDLSYKRFVSVERDKVNDVVDNFDSYSELHVVEKVRERKDSIYIFSKIPNKNTADFSVNCTALLQANGRLMEQVVFRP